MHAPDGRSPRLSLPLRFALVIVAVSTLMGCGSGSTSSPSQAGAGTSSASQTSGASNDSASAPQNVAVSGSPSPAASTVTVAATPSPTPTPPADGALVGLSADDHQRFLDGLDAFNEVEAAPRLGPLFNGHSCAECHTTPSVGGGSGIVVTRFGRLSDGVFDPLASLGGSLLQSFAVAGQAAEQVPTQANVRTFRRTTAIFAAGVVEAIPDSAISEYAAWQTRNAPQQAGQLSFVTSVSDGTVHVGRFGWKCQQALLLDFSADAYFNEMGVSSALFPFENRPNQPTVSVPLEQVEDQPDASGLRDLDRFAVFMRYLGPLPTRAAAHTADDLDRDPVLGRGYVAFTKAACAVCHRPSWVAGGTDPAIVGRRVWSFSDYLLHDVGTGDGIVQGDAPANKLRTAPLMGIGSQPMFLHDGSARTLDDAIQRHGTEAATARDRYLRTLTQQERADLLAFLRAI